MTLYDILYQNDHLCAVYALASSYNKGVVKVVKGS